MKLYVPKAVKTDGITVQRDKNVSLIVFCLFFYFFVYFCLLSWNHEELLTIAVIIIR